MLCKIKEFDWSTKCFYKMLVYSQHNLRFSQIYWKNQILPQSIKKERNRLSMILDPFLFCLSEVRSWKNYIQFSIWISWRKWSFLWESGFRPSDSYEYKLLSIVHYIYASFDCSPPSDVRGIFYDIFKAFDRVRHDGLIYKIKCIGINSQIDNKFLGK